MTQWKSAPQFQATSYPSTITHLAGENCGLFVVKDAEKVGDTHIDKMKVPPQLAL